MNNENRDLAEAVMKAALQRLKKEVEINCIMPERVAALTNTIDVLKRVNPQIEEEEVQQIKTKITLDGRKIAKIIKNPSRLRMRSRDLSYQAQAALEQFTKGGKTINQVRQEFGLSPIDDELANIRMSKLSATIKLENIDDIKVSIDEMQKKMNQIKDLENDIRSIADSIEIKLIINN